MPSTSISTELHSPLSLFLSRNLVSSRQPATLQHVLLGTVFATAILLKTRTSSRSHPTRSAIAFTCPICHSSSRTG